MKNDHSSPGLRLRCATGAAFVGALALSLSAGASNATLRSAVDKWSLTIGADAHSVSLAARARHPRRMAYSALRFRRDALRARTVIAAQHPSSANGQKAKKLALAAFTDYASAGSRWAATGRARLQNQRAVADRDARAATASATAGNRLLVKVAALLR